MTRRDRRGETPARFAPAAGGEGAAAPDADQRFAACSTRTWGTSLYSRLEHERAGATSGVGAACKPPMRRPKADLVAGETTLAEARAAQEDVVARGCRTPAPSAQECRDRLRAAEGKREFNRERTAESQGLLGRYETELSGAEEAARGAGRSSSRPPRTRNARSPGCCRSARETLREQEADPARRRGRGGSKPRGRSRPPNARRRTWNVKLAAAQAELARLTQVPTGRRGAPRTAQRGGGAARTGSRRRPTTRVDRK